MSEQTAKALGMVIPQWYDAAGNAYRAASVAHPVPVSLNGKKLTKYFAVGTTAGTLVKSGGGRLDRVVFSQVVSTAVVTIYDNTMASGTVLFASGALPAITLPTALDFGGIPFAIGLTLVVATANASLVFTFE